MSKKAGTGDRLPVPRTNSIRYHFDRRAFLRVRQASGLTLTQLSSLMGLSHVSLQAWETKRVSPRFVHVIAAADILGVSPYEFVAMEDGGRSE